MDASLGAIPNPPRATPGPVAPTSFEVRWSAVVAARFDRFGACGEDGGHARVELVLGGLLVDDRRVVLEAWVEAGGHRRPVLGRRSVPCRVLRDGGLTHVDVEDDGLRLLALSVRGADELVYVQSDLLPRAGFGGGTFDSPVYRPVDSRRDVATA